MPKTNVPNQARSSSVRLPQPLIRDLKTIADREERSFADTQRYALQRYVDWYFETNGRLTPAEESAPAVS